jgi:hypothetical protein
MVDGWHDDAIQNRMDGGFERPQHDGKRVADFNLFLANLRHDLNAEADFVEY